MNEQKIQKCQISFILTLRLNGNYRSLVMHNQSVKCFYDQEFTTNTHRAIHVCFYFMQKFTTEKTIKLCLYMSVES